MRRTTDHRAACSRGIEPLAHQLGTRVAVTVLCLTFGNPSSKFWLTPVLHAASLEHAAKPDRPLATARPFSKFCVKAREHRALGRQSYRESRGRWQRFSCKGRGIRAIRHLLALIVLISHNL